MRPDGTDLVNLWREAGEWWTGEPYREIAQVRDSKGVIREQPTELPSLAKPYEVFKFEPYHEDQTEDWDLRVKKVRDEKVAKAVGLVQPIALPKLHTASLDGSYTLLHAVSGYSFGRSSMLAEEIAPLCASKGISAVLLADHMTLSGAHEFDKLARKVGIRPLIGASLEMPEGGEIVLIAQNGLGWRSLCRLISECHLKEPRQFPLCTWERLQRNRHGVICLTGGHNGVINRMLMRRDYAAADSYLVQLQSLFPTFVQIERCLVPWEKSVNASLLELSEHRKTIAVAGGTVNLGNRTHFPAQDMLCCIDTLCQIEEVTGRKPQRDDSQPAVKPVPRRWINAERFIRSPRSMGELFADRLELLDNTHLIPDMCDDNVLPGLAPMPSVFDDDALALREIVLARAKEIRPNIPSAYRKRIGKELSRIIQLGFASHFMIAWEMCDWARSQSILFSGRGSVVDSAVAYCLGLSRIDAFEHDLHFERFLPGDGSKRPDIDIDFEAARREDVRQHLVEKYGRDNVATVAAIGSFGSRGIVREVGKVLGIPEDSVSYLAKRLHGGVSPEKLEAAIDGRPELRDSGIPRERFHWVFRLAERLMDMPRNMRAHSSGVVVSSDPICDWVPVMLSGVDCVRILQWDKRSAKRCFDKFDVLCLRGNDVLSGTQRSVREIQPDFLVEGLPLDDPEVFRTFRSGNLIGIPQSASPAMRQAHIRLKTEDLRDASLVQAGIRPGVGGAVKINELIARRRGKPFTFTHPEMERILGHTYGIIVFQEQVDQLLETFGGYTPGEAEEIREAIHKRRREEFVKQIRDQVIAKILENGYDQRTAVEVYDLVAVFQGYGFAQGHALAFAEVSIRSVWCQQNYPTEYFAALLNAQPAGYYGPCTIANEARIRGVEIRQPDVNLSDLQFSVEDVAADHLVVPRGGIRVGLNQIANIGKDLRLRIVDRRKQIPYESFHEFVSRVEPNRDELECLILSGALDSMFPNRRAMLWAIPDAINYLHSSRTENSLGILTATPTMPSGVEDFSESEKAIHERTMLGLDVHRHLMSFERDRVTGRGGLTAAEAGSLAAGTRAFVVGNPIRLRFPPTASGRRVVFFDLEDETGILNVTCFDDTYQQDGHAIICSQYATVRGVAQDRDGHIAFLAQRVFPYEPTLKDAVPSLPLKAADFLVG
jgi:error-prone DNA polymerase